MLSIKMLWLRRMSSVKLLQRNSLKAALENGPKFDDFVVGTADNAVQGDFTASNVPGTGRLPKWLKTPIAVGQRYTHLKDTLRDLKLHTVSNDLVGLCLFDYLFSFYYFLALVRRFVKRRNVLILVIVGMEEKLERQRLR